MGNLLKKGFWLILMFTPFWLNAQEWERVMELPTLEKPEIFADSEGFIYLTGYTKGSKGHLITENDSTDYHFYKIHNISKHIVWSAVFSSTEHMQVANTAIGKDGKIYAAGHFRGKIYTENVNASSKGAEDLFIISCDQFGQLSIEMTEGGTGREIVGGFDTDAVGNFYITGALNGITRVGGTDHTARSNTDFYLMKLNPLLTPEWLRIGTSTGFSYPYSAGTNLRLGDDSFIYLQVSGNARYDAYLIGCGDTCDVLTKFDREGNYVTEFSSFYNSATAVNTMWTADKNEDLLCSRKLNVLLLDRDGNEKWNHPLLINSRTGSLFLSGIAFRKKYILTASEANIFSSGRNPFLIFGSIGNGIPTKEIRLPYNTFQVKVRGFDENRILVYGNFNGKIKLGDHYIKSAPDYNFFMAVLSFPDEKNDDVTRSTIKGCFDENNKSDILSIEIYDLFGNTVFKGNAGDLSKLPGFSSGLYIVRSIKENEFCEERVFVK